MHHRRGRDCELCAVSYELNGHDRGRDHDCKLQNADAHELNDRGHDCGHDYGRDHGHGNQLVDLLAC